MNLESLPGGASKKVVGDDAESKVCSFLQSQGLSLLEKNYRCRQGEVDLIMRDHECIVFVEVRYRKSGQFGSALDTITAKKQKKVRLAAQTYLLHKKIGETYPCRFDAVGLTGHQNPNLDNWIKNAF